MKMTEASMMKMLGVNHIGEIQYCLRWPNNVDGLACKDASQRGVAGKPAIQQMIVCNRQP